MWKFLVDNYKFTFILITGVLIFGMASIAQIPKESNPDVDIPVIIVNTVFPGAGAEDVELLVTNQLEDALVSISDIEDISSVSAQNISSITIQFDVSSDTDEKLTEVKDKIDLAKNDLPDDAQDPVAQKIRLSDVPIITYTVSGDYSIEELTRYAKELKKELESVSGVSDVSILGGVDREIQVLIDKARLDQFGLSLNEVTQAIQLANTDIPVGTIETSNTNYIVNLKGKLESVEDVKTIPVTSNQDVVITISDISTVTDGFSKQGSIARLSTNQSESKPSVSLRVFKSSGGNVLSIVDSINERIDAIKASTLPTNLQVVATEDNAEYIRKDLTDLTQSGLQTVLIVVVILFFFIGLKESILAGASIPLSFLLTFAILQSQGITLNFLTLFSLILSLGILVDSAIVVTQGIHNYMEQGLDAYNATVKTIKEFQFPLLSGTLTTVFAFLPMLLTSGIMGEYIKSIPQTVTVVLISSIIVSLGFITTISAHIFKKKNQSQNREEKMIFKRAKNFKKAIKDRLDSLKNIYTSLFDTVISSKRKRKYVTVLSIVLFFASMSLPISGFLTVNMFPQSDESSIYVNIEASPGTTLKQTDNALRQVEAIIQKNKYIERYVVTAGSAAQAGSTSSGSENAGGVIINLSKNRDKTSEEIVTDLEEEFGLITSADVTISQATNGPESSSPVEIVIKGDDLIVLEQLSKEFEGLLKDLPGTRNVSTNFKESNPEFVLNLDRLKARVFGLQTNQIAFTLRNAVTGVDATSLNLDGEEVDVMVKYNLNTQSTNPHDSNKVPINTINTLTLSSQQGDIPLQSIATSGLGNSRNRIDHRDGKRIARITSDTAEGVAAQEIFAQVEEKKGNIQIPAGYSVRMGGEREDIDKSFADMFRAMILGILLIFALLVLQFGSYKQPFYILTTIPLALIGVFPGLALLNLPLSFPAIIGIVALVGIVVNNAIILIDRINKNREEGMVKQDAIREAALTRFDPILLTTVTTIFGLLPLALRDITWGPLGWSIIFGLAISTFLTLLIIPLLYNRFEK